MPQKKDYTPYQQEVIRRYYENREAIVRQRLAEKVTDLYLADGKRRERLWKSVAVDLEKIGLSRQRIDHLLKKADPALLADVIQELDRR